MWSTKREIEEGDLVIIWLTRDLVHPVVVTPGKDYNNKFGLYRHSDLIGLPYGSKVASRTGRGFVHVLRPTPELWTMALPHRTQILYLADIAFITSWLDIKPGSKVIEAGTGSGSFSHSITRTIGPTGHLWSYEFHEARALKAREEFAQHGMSETVTLTHRNVCKEGFTVFDTADAVFLDLPAPWDAVDHAKAALRKDRSTRICCFSPCMEQVLRTVNALNEAGFTDITMYETLIRPHETSQFPALKSVREVGENLKLLAVKREAKRQKQIANSRARNQQKTQIGANGVAKRKRDEGGEQLDDTSKRIKTDEEDAGEIQVPSVASLNPTLHDGTSLPDTTGPAATSPPRSLNVSKVFPEVRGHTSYLTFACLVPATLYEPIEQAAVDQNETSLTNIISN